MHPDSDHFHPLTSDRQRKESLQLRLTRGDWPARLAARLPGGGGRVRLVDHALDCVQSLGSARTLTLAFASDFHAGPFTAAGLIDRALDRLAEAEADLWLLGGDFVSLHLRKLEDLAARLAERRPPGGAYAVLGNHDHWAGGRAVARILERRGIRVLINEGCALPAPWQNTWLAGLDDHLTGRPDAAAALGGGGMGRGGGRAEGNDNGDDPRGAAGLPRIVLMHAPSGLLDLGDAPFTVALAGHTHGGQIALPGGRPIIVPPGALSRRYPGGRYDLGAGRTLIVSRGVGCGGLPLRVNAPAEVLRVRLRGAIPAERDAERAGQRLAPLSASAHTWPARRRMLSDLSRALEAKRWQATSGRSN